jgi:hypothetical protein
MSEHLPHSSAPEIQAPNEPVPEPLQWLKDNGLPIIGLLLLVAFLCLVGHYCSIKIDWATTRDFTGAIRDLVQAIAYCAAGCWAYFKFIKGRTFQESLTPAVTGRFVLLDGAVYLIATIQIKNVGTSKIDFNRKATALILYEYFAGANPDIHAVADRRLTSFAVFKEKDRSIEPSESIEVQQLISVHGSLKFAYRLEVEIFSNAGFSWTAAAIVDESSLRDNLAAMIG